MQGLDCLNIHSHNTIDDKDLKTEAMDQSDETKAEEGRGMKAETEGRIRQTCM